MMVSQQFAQCLCAFQECSNEIQMLVVEMAQIASNPEAPEDERHAAVATIAEALFACRVNDMPGVELEDVDRKDSDAESLAAMDQEETTFAERLAAMMAKADMTQADLAAAIGVGQPAISMMLARTCRPQRRTVEKLASALRVLPEEIWPSYRRES
jgi:lambda repressor-like predicted transcriptional regulator